MYKYPETSFRDLIAPFFSHKSDSIENEMPMYGASLKFQDISDTLNTQILFGSLLMRVHYWVSITDCSLLVILLYSLYF